MLCDKPFECPGALLALAAQCPPVPVAVAGAGHPLAMESARLIADSGVARPILVGERERIRALAEAMEWDIRGLNVVDAPDEAEAARTAAAIAGSGEARALMKGHVHTDAFMLAALDRSANLRTGRRLTHTFHMTVPGQPRALLITDAAVNVAPDLETRFHAMTNAVALARALGTSRPKVAILSATEEPNPRMPSSMEAAALAERAARELPDADVCGPLAFDLAVCPAAARTKQVDHPVAGNADIVLVPNIETGNALFKMMVYFMSACAAGIVLGARVPILLTSRADPPEARLASAAIASVLAHRG